MIGTLHVRRMDNGEPLRPPRRVENCILELFSRGSAFARVEKQTDKGIEIQYSKGIWHAYVEIYGETIRISGLSDTTNENGHIIGAPHFQEWEFVPKGKGE